MTKNSLRTCLLFGFLVSLFSGPMMPLAAQLQEDSRIQPRVDDSETVGRIVFREESLLQVLALLEMYTGRAVIRPAALPNPTFSFNSQRPLTRQEAILAIESLLTINGIGVAPLGDQFIKVMPIANVRTEAPELVLESLQDRAPSGRVVSRLIRLRHIDPAAVQPNLQPFLSPGFGNIVVFQNTNAFLLTDTISNLIRMERVIEEIDQPVDLNIETRFYELQYANAREMENRLRQILDATRTTFQQGARTRAGARQAGGQGNEDDVAAIPAAGLEQGRIPLQVLFGDRTTINSDERTNQLIIISDPANLSFFDDFVAKLDVAVDPLVRNEVIPIKHANAREMTSLLSQLVTGGARGNGRLDIAPDRARRPGAAGRETFREPAGARDREQETEPRETNRDPIDAVGELSAQFSDHLSIIADERSNAIVVSGTATDLRLIRDVIEQIDVLLAQVRIEVVIAEVTLSRDQARGIESFGFEITPDYDFGFGIRGPGFQIDRGVDATLSAVFETAKTRSDINLLSVPTVVTTHNREATIIVGQARPIVTATQTAIGTGDALRSTFTFQDIGIELRVTPLIGPDGVIQLEIEQKIDDIVDTIVIDGNPQPVIGRREASSFVSVRNREMVILGGLQSERDQSGETRVAFFGSLPLLGELFKTRSRERQRTELLVFIRPTVLADVNEANADAARRIEGSTLKDGIDQYIETERVPEREPKPEPEPEPQLQRSRFHK